MTIYYSPTTKGFYDTDFGYPSLPQDIIEITKEQHQQFLHGMNMQNKELVLSEGNLVLQDRVVVITWEQIKSRRNNLLTSSDYTQMADWPGDKTAWAAYRQALRDLPQTYANAADVVWPSKPGE
jgi:hypothetical protein